MMTPRERYETDPQFRNLVSVMVHQLYICNFTPSELREAAILASILYDESKGPRVLIKHKEIHDFLNGVTDFLNGVKNNALG